jgi:hypothetical protein
MKANTKSTDSMAIMATPTEIKAESAPSVHSNEIVCTLGDLAGLTKAVRDGDLSTIGDLCARLFYLNSEQKSRVISHLIASQESRHPGERASCARCFQLQASSVIPNEGETCGAQSR